MPVNRLPIGSYVRTEKTELQAVLDTLKEFGFLTVGPRMVDEAIVYGELDTIDQLPIGIVDEQDGGKYRLHRSTTDSWFDYTVGPESLKKYLFPPRETLFESHYTDGNWQFDDPDLPSRPLAVIGSRACDLHAMAIQDRVFLKGPYVDPGYQRRRQDLFVVAVNCRRAAPVCFCHSMGTGPAVQSDFDLALTEMSDHFVVEIGSERGGTVISATEWSPCTLDQVEEARTVVSDLRAKMQARDSQTDSVLDQESPRERSLDTTGIRELLLGNLDHARWEEIAQRCLSCANCTLVCPTCFCCSVEEVSDLSGEHVQRERTWGSCFNAEHSYTNTGVVRKTTSSRYRQWLTHKLATWEEQFGVSGCVGCGRCITWCPVGIDLTVEVAAMRGDQP